MDSIFTGFANLIRTLPTGTYFMFLFLNPLLTNEGNCHSINKYLTIAQIVYCGFSCFFSCFIDCYRDSNGKKHYGIATIKGLWPPHTDSSVNLSNHKLRFSDFVHGLLSVIVFAVLTLLSPNTVKCLYPAFESDWLIKWLPLVIGVVFGVSARFPNKRRGLITYIPSDDYTLLG